MLTSRRALVIFGPTASGKTALAIRLAKRFNGEIISADSRQVYKGLDIGTGKVSFESKVEKHRKYWVVDGVKIHGFDLIDPGISFTVADFLKFTYTSIIQIIKVNKLPIVVGGTGFYIKALIDGIGSIGIPQNPMLRQELEGLAAQQLYQKLLKIDPGRARTMNTSDCANPRRLIRAIEVAVYKTSTSEESEPTSEVTSYPLPATHYQLISLTAPNEYLYEKADKWLEVRLNHGMIEEVQSLLDQKVSPVWLDNLGLEYRWVSRYLKKEIDYHKMVERLKGDIHGFIRRQKTWFNKFKNISLFDISKPNWQNGLGKIVALCYTLENGRSKKSYKD